MTCVLFTYLQISACTIEMSHPTREKCYLLYILVQSASKATKINNTIAYPANRLSTEGFKVNPEPTNLLAGYNQLVRNDLSKIY